MKKLILGFLIGVAVVVALIWHYSNKNDHAALIKRDLTDAYDQTRVKVEEKISSLTNISTDDIKAELAKTGQVVRQKAQEVGKEVSDATADPRTAAAIKAKIVADESLAGLGISVDCSKGEVTLSGKATSAENISKAIKIAYDTDGVRKVTSKIELK
jgi:hyperosmotically inducible protein